MRLSHAVTTVTAVVLSAAPALAPTTPALAPTMPAGTTTVPVPTRVVVAATTATGTYGQAVGFRGHVDGACSAPAGYCPLPDSAVTVRLDRRLAGTSTWRTVATGSGHDRFTLATRAVANAAYRVRYVGGVATANPATDDASPVPFDFQASASGQRMLQVARNLHDAHPSGTRIAGNVDPGWGHRYLTVLRRTCRGCAYRGYRRILTTGTGGFSVVVPAPRRGSSWYRLRLPAAGRYVAGWSAVYRAYRP